MHRLFSGFLKPVMTGIFLIFFLLPHVFPSFAGWLDALVYPHLPNWNKFEKSKDELFAENLKLQKQKEQFHYEKSRLKSLRQENAKLRQALKLKPAPTMHLLSAQVRARAPQSWNTKFTIELGNTDGIRALQPVLNNGILTGRVTDIIGKKAKVKTLLHKDISISCHVAEAKVLGILNGALEISAKNSIALLTYLPRDIELEKGQLVETSGFGQHLPAGIKVGHIISSQIEGSYRTAQVQLAANLQELDFVSILVVEDQL